MSDPLTDMSLLPPPGEPLNVYPLEPVPLKHLPAEWTRQIRRRARGQPELWQVTRHVRLHLPGVPLLAAEGPCWRSHPGSEDSDPIVELFAGFVYDGASGPALNNPAALLGAAAHDVVVRRIDGRRVYAYGWCLRGAPQVCPSYWRRAWLYGAILAAQGESRFRVAYSTAAVAAYDLVIEPFVWRARDERP